MEPQQTLKVMVHAVNAWGAPEIFFAHMGKDGRIFIPQLQGELMKSEKETNLIGYIIKVTIEPTP
jgi:hypothetical protein